MDADGLGYLALGQSDTLAGLAKRIAGSMGLHVPAIFAGCCDFVNVFPRLAARQSVAALIAAILFAVAGFQMVFLRSVGGQSVAEYFYQSMGYFSFGMTMLSLAVALRPAR